MHTSQHDSAAAALRNRNVRFLVNDVYVPEPVQVLAELHSRDLLQGKVIDLSDRGTDRNAFAVVAVAGLSQPVVVPTARILAVEDE
jgi:hypothetical protein